MFTVDKKLENDDKTAVLVRKRKKWRYNFCTWGFLCESEHRQVINFGLRSGLPFPIF
jgi:hypothetical protein